MTDETKEILETINMMFTSLSSEIKELKEDTVKLNKSVETSNERLSKLEITVENSTNRNIQLLTEGFGHVMEKVNKLDHLSDDVGEIKDEIDVIKKAVITHSNQINNLTKIK